MSLCEFTYTKTADGYDAACAACGRHVKVKSEEVYAACKSSKDYAETHARITGLVAGPGTYLKEFLSRWLGIEPAGNCPCEKHARVMDMWGADECERRLDEIVGWLRDEHDRRRGAGETRLPWSEVIARQLVKRAIGRARAKAATAD